MPFVCTVFLLKINEETQGCYRLKGINRLGLFLYGKPLAPFWVSLQYCQITYATCSPGRMCDSPMNLKLVVDQAEHLEFLFSKTSSSVAQHLLGRQRIGIYSIHTLPPYQTTWTASYSSCLSGACDHISHQSLNWSPCSSICFCGVPCGPLHHCPRTSTAKAASQTVIFVSGRLGRDVSRFRGCLFPWNLLF